MAASLKALAVTSDFLPHCPIHDCALLYAHLYFLQAVAFLGWLCGGLVRGSALQARLHLPLMNSSADL
jgi:hypothetical protein